MALAEDVARWIWHQDRSEEIFEDRSPGHFAESWPEGKSLAVLRSFDMSLA